MRRLAPWLITVLLLLGWSIAPDPIEVTQRMRLIQLLETHPTDRIWTLDLQEGEGLLP